MQGFKQMLIYGIGIFVLKGFGFIMMPIVTRLLTQVEYGELNFLVSIAAMVSLFLTLGLGETLFRFADGQDAEANAKVMRQCFYLSSRCAIICVVLALGFSDNIAALLPVTIKPLDLQLLLVSLAVSSVLTVPYCYFRMTGRALPFMCFSIAQGVSQTMLSIVLLTLGYGVTGMMISSAVSSSLVAIATVIYFRADLQGGRAEFDKRHYQYIGYIICSMFFLYCLNGAENWLVIIHLGKQQLAIFYAAGQFALMISVAFEPFRMWWFARRYNVYKTDPQACAEQTVLGVQIGMLIAAAMLICAPLLMAFMLPESYADSAHLVPWLCLIMSLKFHSELLNIGCFLKKNASLAPAINGGCALVLLSSGYFLLEHFGIAGLLFSMALVALLRCSLFYVISQRMVFLNYNNRQLLLSWLCFLLLLGTSQLIQDHNSSLYLFSVMGLFAVNVLLIAYGYRHYWRGLSFSALRRAISS